MGIAKRAFRSLGLAGALLADGCRLAPPTYLSGMREADIPSVARNAACKACSGQGLFEDGPRGSHKSHQISGRGSRLPVKHIENVPRGVLGTWSFPATHKTGKGDCGERTVAAAAMLRDNGYGECIVAMADENADNYHWFYVYKENGKFGSIGSWLKTQGGKTALGNDTQPPVHRSVVDLVKAVISERPPDEYTRWGIANLRQISKDYARQSFDMGEGDLNVEMPFAIETRTVKR